MPELEKRQFPRGPLQLPVSFTLHYNPDYGNKADINYALGLRFLDVPEAQPRWIEGYITQTLGRMKPE